MNELSFRRSVARRIYRALRRHRAPRTAIQRKIEEALRRTRNPFFVQIGSADGKLGDPIHELIRSHRSWRGLFVEPVPWLFDRLRGTYGEDGRFRYANVAIDRVPGTRAFYSLSESARTVAPDLPWWTEQLGSFQRSHITKHLPGELDAHIVETGVPCLTLAQLFERYDVDAVHLLHVDAEGSDAVILKQVDFDELAPTVILYEHKHLEPRENDEVLSILDDNGYRIHAEDADTLALRGAPA